MNSSDYKEAEIVFHPNDTHKYKYVRSTDGWIAGVCEGMAKQTGLPSWVLRVIWVLFTLLAFGTGIIIYAILAFCLPDENTIAVSEQKRVLGVCLRLSRVFNMEVGLVRVLTVLLALASLGITVLGYFVLNFVIPDRPKPLF